MTHDKEYRETHEFWIDVIEKDTTPSPLLKPRLTGRAVHSETPDTKTTPAGSL